MGPSISKILFLLLVCIATAIAAGSLFLKSEHTNVAWLLTFACVASTAKLVQALENESPYERGLEAANLVLRNRRMR